MDLPELRPTRQQRRQLEAENKSWPEALTLVPETMLPRDDSLVPRDKQPIQVWRSREFLVQIFQERGGVQRLSILRTQHDGNRFVDGISWDDLQRLKSECGRGDKDAIEIFPADRDVVNVANLRHLWVLPAPLPIAWRARPKGESP